MWMGPEFLSPLHWFLFWWLVQRSNRRRRRRNTHLLDFGRSQIACTDVVLDLDVSNLFVLFFWFVVFVFLCLCLFMLLSFCGFSLNEFLSREQKMLKSCHFLTVVLACLDLEKSGKGEEKIAREKYIFLYLDLLYRKTFYSPLLHRGFDQLRYY